VTAIVDRATLLTDDPARTLVCIPREPRWPRLALAGLLILTALLYLWNLPVNGYGNAYYAAAAQAGSQSWSAWFFGSLDPNDFVSVDKPPAALWVTGLSVRMFGMNPWAVQAPQALMAVAAVAVLYAAVRRAVPQAAQGAAAGLLAGAVLALTPVAVLMFRYNNPDALLTLLITIAAYCLARAVPAASWRWLALAGLSLGFAFLTKMFAGLMVLPAMGLAYLSFAPIGWRKRLGHLLTAGVALVVSAGWWVLVVQLWPTDARPYISNSADNSVLGLAFGYNGINRIIGRGGRSALGGGHSGPRRLFTAEMANEISWLLPVALLAVCFGGYLWLRGALSRGERAALVSWAGWILLSGGVFSYSDGMVHPYYTVALAPAVSALVGLGGMLAWRHRSGWDGRAAFAAMMTSAAGWAVLLLHRNAFGPPGLRWAIGAAALGALGLLIIGSLRWPRVLSVAAALGLIAGIAGTSAFAIATAAATHDGAIPNAVHTAAVGPSAGRRIEMPGAVRTGNSQADTALGALLRATSTRWSAATTGAQSASALEIASGTAVMAVGGWNNDPVPTLADFIAEVRARRISYYIENGRGHGLARYGREIAEWVAHNYRPAVVGGTKVYRLIDRPRAASSALYAGQQRVRPHHLCGLGICSR
jgi:4-amino-4-deoxy-L-arabinose transferase-like glycosyltransferase